MEPPPFAAALMQAYHTATGIQLSMSHSREHTLSEIHERGLTAQDIASVLNEIKKLIKQQAKGYSDRSLDWRNCMADVDILEERCLRLRQRAMRQGKAAPMVPAERHDGNGVIRVLEPAAPDLNVPPAEVRAAFNSLTQQLRPKTA